ncbi:MAG TPA: SDR family oxidoreductase [Anaerolineales bacterium]|nr:SDR family oxidoreductase [Anaerolineales bacterium]
MTEKKFSKMIHGFEKVTIVTGGTRGIGEGCARVFARAGAPVVICEPDQEIGRAVAKTISEEEKGDCRFVRCDVRNPDEIKNLIEETVKMFGRLDCLINNAGWHPPHYPIDKFSIEDLKDLLQLNLVSVFAGCKYALPYLRQTRGSIINISSLVGRIGQEWAATYVTTKGGVTALTKALAVDEARHGVRVFAVEPGAIDTPLLRSFIQAAKDPQASMDAVESYQWTGRIGTIEEVGEVCLFLASDSASFLNGNEVIVSSGAELAYGIKFTKQGSAL